MANKKRKNNSIYIIFILVLLIILFFTSLTTKVSYIFKKSINTDASRYSNRHALVFYPNNDYGKKYAKNLAKKYHDDRIYDYSLVPFGDYYLVSYTNEDAYFVDKDYNLLKIENINEDGKNIISDYLRYQIKKEKPDLYYTSKFMLDSSADNLKIENIDFELTPNGIKAFYKDYDIDIYIPLKYIEILTGLNFNYQNVKYIKPTYIDVNDKHPLVCLSFDSGPDFYNEIDKSCSKKIVDTLYKYDACATFFVTTESLLQRNKWSNEEVDNFISQSIIQGNEYASSGKDERILTNLSAQEILETINDPKKYFLNHYDYEMKIYRPASGFVDDYVFESDDMPAILWSIDSYDWKYTSQEEIFDRLSNIEMYDGDIIILHDIYEETADSLEKIIVDYLEKGYQLISVSDMLKGLGLNVNDLSYYYNFNPPYFE